MKATTSASCSMEPDSRRSLSMGGGRPCAALRRERAGRVLPPELQLLGQGFQAAGDGRDLLGAILIALLARWRARWPSSVADSPPQPGRGRRGLCLSRRALARISARDESRRIVDEQARLDQLVQCALQLGLVFVGRKPVLQLVLVHPACDWQHTAQQRLLAHFQAENGHNGLAWLMAAFSAMLMARAVFPMEGRAAMMINSPFCRPLVMLSKSPNRWPGR
jgi:hypothetical protein